MEEGGKLFAQAIVAISKELIDSRNEDSTLTPEKVQEVLLKNITSMQETLLDESQKEGPKLTRTTFNILLFLLANYADMESAAYTKSGIGAMPEEQKNYRKGGLKFFIHRVLAGLGEAVTTEEGKTQLGGVLPKANTPKPEFTPPPQGSKIVKPS